MRVLQIGALSANIASQVYQEFGDRVQSYVVAASKAGVRSINASLATMGQTIQVAESMLSSEPFSSKFFDALILDLDPKGYSDMKKLIEIWMPKIRNSFVFMYLNFESECLAIYH